MDWSELLGVSCNRLLEATLLLDGNHHGLAPVDGTEDDSPGSGGAGSDDMPFPGRLIETLARLKSLGRAALRAENDCSAEDETELPARVMVLSAPRFPTPVDQPHDKFDVTGRG
jgi:hypothetical protein